MTRNGGDNRGPGDRHRQQQHVDLHRKRLLRQRLLAALDRPGPAYVPFVGDGDLAVECYADRPIYAVDVDPDRVATARTRLPDATVVQGDADLWHPDLAPDLGPYTVADFDAYAYPYASFRSWWEHAPRADRVAVVFTDGQRLNVNRAGVGNPQSGYRHPDGTFVRWATDAERSRISRTYWTTVLHPWLEAVATEASCRIVDTGHYTRGAMVYWGAVLDRATPDRGARATKKTPRSGSTRKAKKPGDRRVRWSDEVADQVVDRVRAGATIEEAAEAAGVSKATVLRHSADDEDGFAANLAAAVAHRGSTRADSFDEEAKAAYVDELASGHRSTIAAKNVGVHPATVRRHRRIDAEFDDACRWADTAANELVEDGLFESARSGNVTAAIFWLTNRDPERWRDRRNVAALGAHRAGAQSDREEHEQTAAHRVEAVPEDVLAAVLAQPGGPELLDRLDDMLSRAEGDTA